MDDDGVGSVRLARSELNELLALARDYAVATPDSASHVRYEGVSRLLKRLRQVMRMDVVFVSEFVQGMRVFRSVDVAEGGPDAVRAGAADPMEESYCLRVVQGRLPRAIPNAMELPECRALPATQAIPVGAHLSVPIVLPGGGVFGTLCCFSRRPDPTLDDSDAKVLQAIADLIAAGIDKHGNLRGTLLLRDVAPKQGQE